MLDCKLQLFRDSYHHSKSPCFKNQVNTNGRCLANSSDTTARFDYKAKLTPQHRATPQRSSNARQTENVFQIISGNSKCSFLCAVLLDVLCHFALTIV